jgi:hypothetical protein
MPELKTINGRLEIDGKPVIKGWESFTGWYWFALEKDSEQVSEINGRAVPDVIWFGLVQGFEDEYGYFSEAEIKALGSRAWPIKAVDLPYAGRRAWAPARGLGLLAEAL